MARQARILLAEDDDAMRHFLMVALRRSGHVVDGVSDGGPAVAALADNVYDLVITDLRMPGVDGMGVARAAEEKGLGAKTLFVTGYANQAREACAEQGWSDDGPTIVSKPFQLDEFVSEVDTILSRGGTV